MRILHLLRTAANECAGDLISQGPAGDSGILAEILAGGGAPEGLREGVVYTCYNQFKEGP